MKIERRMAVEQLELRDDASGTSLSGYASTFNQPYDMGWYSEQVAPGAFKRSLGQQPDVRLLINHAGLPLARTTSGTLTLSEDARGLKVDARLDPSDPDVAALLPKMRRGDLNQMSFGFRLMGDTGDEWSDDMSTRTLRALDIHDGDVSVVTYPANPGTHAAVRGDTVAIDAVQSAMRTLEHRGASTDEVRAVFLRALAHLDAPEDAVTGTETPEIVVLDVTPDSDTRAADAAREARERTLRLLG
jgi:HK97 family phage prohead protease